MLRLSFIERAALQSNPIGKKLFELMVAKQSNLALSADVTSKKALLALANELGPYVCILKTHIDIIEDADLALTEALVALAQKHQFLIFEDRKFADIGNTVKLQYEGGPYKIASWTDITNFHLLPGPGILDGLKAAQGKRERGFLILAEMSSNGNFFTQEYKAATIKLAEQNADSVIGFICQRKQSKDPRFLHITPGVNLAVGVDALGQQYRTPETAIVKEGCDIVIVGRGIIEADERVATAQQYRLAAWQAYQKTQGVA